MLHQDTSRTDLLAIIELLTALVTSGLEAERVMKEVAERAALLTHATGAAVELAEGDEMVYAVACGSAAHAGGIRLRREGSLSGLCVEQGSPLYCKDTSVDPRVDREACERVGVGSMICVPLFHQERPVGVLKVLSQEKNAFDESQAQILNMLATVIAASLANAHRYADADFERGHDVMTGLPNRRSFDEELAAECARARVIGYPVSLGLLDLNGLKAVNDKRGHLGGDEVLRRAASALRHSTRSRDRCYRVSGDEFAVLLPETSGPEAERVVMRVKREIARIGMGISACAGVAELESWMQATDLQAGADAALYVDKQLYVDKHMFYLEAGTRRRG